MLGFSFPLGLEVGEDFFVGTGEGEMVELFGCEPAALKFGGWIRKFRAPSFERDAVASDGVLDDAERFGGGDVEVVGVVGHGVRQGR